MRKHFIVVFISLLLFASCASIENLANQQRILGSGDVRVTLPHTLAVVSVDGEPVRAPSLTDGDYRLLLAEGEHQIFLKYYENWDTPEESGNIFSSAIVSVKASFKSGGVYSFQHPLVDSAGAAEKFVNAPEVWLLDNGNRIDAVVSKEKKTIKETLGVGSILEGLRKGVSEPAEEDKVDHLLKLKAAWSDATEEERDAFWLWIRREGR